MNWKTILKTELDKFNTKNKEKMKRDIIIITALSLMIFLSIVLTALIYIATIEENKPQEEIEVFEAFKFVEAKDWFYDSTFTEKRHIYYETQSKMK